MTRFPHILSVTLITVLAGSPIEANADTLMLSPSADATIYEGVPDGSGGNDYFANGSGQYLFMGRTGQNNGIPALLRRSLIRFDLSSLSDNDLINSVTVSMQINNVALNATADSATLHRLLSDWSEGPSNPVGPEGQGTTPAAGDVTWTDRSLGVSSWQTPGGDFVTAPSATAPYSTAIEPLDFLSTAQLVDDVQGWVVNPDRNHGWILLGDELNIQNARRLDSRENTSTQPMLLIDFTPNALTIFSDGFEGP